MANKSYSESTLSLLCGRAREKKIINLIPSNSIGRLEGSVRAPNKGVASLFASRAPSNDKRAKQLTDCHRFELGLACISSYTHMNPYWGEIERKD